MRHPDSNQTRDQTRRSAIEWLAVAGWLVLLGVVLGVALYRERTALAARESDRLQIQARVIDENLIRQLQGVSSALTGVRDEIERANSAGEEAAIAGRLGLLSDALPGVRTMTLLNADGVIVASSRAVLLGTNASHREFFAVPRQRPDRAMLYVCAPFKSALGPVVIAVGRVLSNARGGFAGVILATLDPEYFQVVLRSVLYAPDMRTSIAHGEGSVFVNMPANEPENVATLAEPESIFARHLRSGQASSLVTGRLDASGEDRMTAMRTLDRAELRMDKPLMAAISRELSAIYLPWRDQALRFGLFYAAIAAGSILGLHLVQRRRRALASLEEAAAQARRQSAERLELALRGADLGLWDLHVPTGNFVINRRERALLGYSEDDDLPQGGEWRNLIHPDDRSVVDAAILPHLHGGADAYDCEHRMRHKDGHYVWLSSQAMIVERGATGQPLRIVGTHMDITERKRIDAELQRAVERLRCSEEQLRDVTDNMPALISRLDPEKRFRFANRAYLDWLGNEPSTLIGRSLREVYGAEAFAAFGHHVDRALAGERVVYERDMVTTHGRRRVEVTLVPHRAGDGSIRGLYSLVSDLTARHDAELQRARSEERLSLALEGSDLALFDWDIAADRIYHSAQASAMRGGPSADETASPAALRAFVHPDDLDAMRASMKAALGGSVPEYHAEFRIRRRSGDWLWVRARGRVVERDAAGRALRLAGTYADINARKVVEARLRHRAEFDALTDLPNRALFVERLRRATGRASPGSPMALLFLDIDRFKNVNDSLGHEAGDQLLKVFASRMRDGVRQSDTVARLAGDEFTVILEGLRGAGDAKALAGKLVETLRAPIDLAGTRRVVTVSVGIAICEDAQTDDAELLRRADAALYEAKRRGRNRYFCEDLSREGSSRDGACREGLDALAGPLANAIETEAEAAVSH